MEKNSILLGIVGLVLGLAIGFVGANYLNRNNQNSITTAQNQIPNQQGIPQQAPKQGQITKTGMLPDVQKVIDKANNEPDNYEAQIKAGEMYGRIDNFEKSLGYYQQAQKLKPDDFDTNVRLAIAFYEAKQFENAETYYQKALEKKPNDADLLTDLGSTFVRRSSPDFDKAIELFDKALEIKPDNELTHYNLGVAYLRKGEKENAQKALEKLKEVKPDSNLISKLEEVINKK